MELQNKTIVHLAQYAAPYEGNFIKSLKYLEQNLKAFGCRFIYIFPGNARNQSWWRDFEKEHFVFTTDSVFQSENELIKIFTTIKPDIIHSHFEGYDIPAKKATGYCKRKYGQQIHIVWHLHDYFSYVSNPIKKLYQHWCFFRHYCWYGKDVSIIGVCDEMREFVKRFKRLSLSPYHCEATIPNGIDSSRIYRQKKWGESVKTFLIYGGRNIQKRIDICLKALKLLPPPILLTIVKGADSLPVVNEFFDGKIPHWVRLIDPQEDIISVLEQADCFISTSVHETFSYAICEATIFGIPVIQSDIPGTKWNERNPSTYVFQSENAEDLAEKIKAVIDTPIATIKTNCEIARDNNLREYSLECWSKKVIDFYQKL